MSKLKIYGFPPSTYTKTALMVAAEAGAEVELVPLEFKKPSHFALHPYGKMPALEHDGVKLFETLAVASYIDRSLGDGALQPSDPAAHARMLQWVSVAIDYAYEDLVNKLHDDQPGADAVTAASEQLKLLDAALADSAYFAGDDLSLADLFLYPMVAFAIDKLSEASTQRLVALNRWRKLVAKRPSVKKAA